MRPAHVEVIYRPHSRYQRSLHAHKDWWDKCNVTWFLRAQTSDKDNNGKLWVDAIVVIFFIAVGTVDVLTASNNDVKLTSRNLNCIFCKSKIALSFWEDKQTRPRLLVLRHFITCLPPEIPPEISFIPALYPRARAKVVGIVNKVFYFLLLTIIYLFSILMALEYLLYFIHLFIPLPFYTATVPSFLYSFIPLLNLNQWSVFISLFMVKYSNLVAVFTNPHIKLRVTTFFLKVVPCICVRFFGKLWFSLESLPGMWLEGKW